MANAAVVHPKVEHLTVVVSGVRGAAAICLSLSLLCLSLGCSSGREALFALLRAVSLAVFAALAAFAFLSLAYSFR